MLTTIKNILLYTLLSMFLIACTHSGPDQVQESGEKENKDQPVTEAVTAESVEGGVSDSKESISTSSIGSGIEFNQ